MNVQKRSVLTAAVCAACIVFIFLSCTAQNAKVRKIAVFVPGITSGNPVYEMLAAGVSQAVDEYNEHKGLQKEVLLTIVEAGTNQAEWASQLTALTASSEYELIVSSNPSIPELAEPLTKQFPNQKFIILDAQFKGGNQIAAVRYNQREQAYLTGFAAAAVSASNSMKYANKQKKIALIAGQEYPVMNTIILPAFIEGAQAAVADTKVEFRIVGNWYDASKGADIARNLYDEGVDVILPIAGGASQGVIAAAKELGFYITWFDDNGFSKAPGYVVSSSVMEQKRAAYEQTMEYLHGKTVFGQTKTLGIRDGYIDFILDDPLFEKTLSEDIRTRLASVYKDIQSGTLVLATQN